MPIVLYSARKDELPPPQKNAKILLYKFWVKDSYENIYAEIPYNVTQWPPYDDECMVDIAKDQEPIYDEEALIGANYDYWDIKVGIDDSFFYLYQSVEGEVSKGTMNPQKINLYSAMVFEPDLLEQMDDIMVFMNPDNKEGSKKDSKIPTEKENDKKKIEQALKKVKFITYAPMAPVLSDKMEAYSINYSFGGKGKMNTDSIKCLKDGPDLIFKIKRDVL